MPRSAPVPTLQRAAAPNTTSTPPRPAPPPVRPVVLSQQDRDAVMNNPLVREVMEVFHARLVDIRPMSKPIAPPAEGTEEQEITE